MVRANRPKEALKHEPEYVEPKEERAEAEINPFVLKEGNLKLDGVDQKKPQTGGIKRPHTTPSWPQCDPVNPGCAVRFYLRFVLDSFRRAPSVSSNV